MPCLYLLTYERLEAIKTLSEWEACFNGRKIAGEVLEKFFQIQVKNIEGTLFQDANFKTCVL